MVDPDAPGPGVITERDILLSLGRGEDPDKELVGDHLTSDLTFASPDWPLERAAAEENHSKQRNNAAPDHGSLRGDARFVCGASQRLARGRAKRRLEG